MYLEKLQILKLKNRIRQELKEKIMENNLNTSALTAERQPDYSNGIMLDAFNEAYDHATNISNPDGFKTALEDIVIQKLIECQTPEEYEEFDSQLKADIIKFIDLYTSEPWEVSAVEPGIAEYIKPAVALVTGKGEFVASDIFTDAVVECAFKTAPYSMQKVTDMLALTDVDLSGKIHNQIFETLDDPKKSLPGFVWRYEDGIEKSSMIIAFHNLIKLYPSEELNEKCIEYAKNHIFDLFYDCVEDGRIEIPGLLDDSIILGFDLQKALKDYLPSVPKTFPVQFDSDQEVDDFVDKQVSRYLIESPEPSYEKFIESETQLVDFAKSIGLEAQLKIVFDKFKNCSYGYMAEMFNEKFKDEIVSIKNMLCWFGPNQALATSTDVEVIVNDDELPEDPDRCIDRSDWDHDESTWC